MAKKKTSKKLGKTLPAKAVKYKPGADVSVGGLKEALVQAMLESDFDTFKGCIAILLDKFEYTDITAATGLSKSTLYRMCEPTSNPTLENVCKVLSFIHGLDESVAA